MNRIVRKLREMENNCVGEFPVTGTHLDFSEFPESEQQMHLKAFQILNSHQKVIENILEKAKLNPNAVEFYSGFSRWEEQIVSKSTDFLLYRINKLYLDTLLILARDDFQKLVISSRLSWFVEQLNLFLKQRNEEDRILSNEAISDEERDLQLKKLGETWVRPFTPETWDKFWKERITPKLREFLITSPEEENLDAKD